MEVQGGYLLLALAAVLHCPPVSCYGVWIRQAGNDLCNTTPADLQASFLSNCWKVLMDNSTCNRAWNAFKGAFAGREPADVVSSDYDDYFDVIPIEVQPDQSLFWSGVPELAGMVSCMCTGVGVVSSLNARSSKIFNNIGMINWCGTTSNTPSQDGIDYSNRCLCSVTGAFWERFSVEFAQVARGTAFYLGYGEKPNGTFQLSSFFAKAELPNLTSPRVNEVVAMVVHRKGKGESCGEGTLVTLKNMITDRKLKYSCYDLFGDPMSQAQELSACAAKIVTAVQNETLPASDDCFEFSGGSDIILPRKFAVTLGLMCALILMFVM